MLKNIYIRLKILRPYSKICHIKKGEIYMILKFNMVFIDFNIKNLYYKAVRHIV